MKKCDCCGKLSEKTEYVAMSEGEGMYMCGCDPWVAEPPCDCGECRHCIERAWEKSIDEYEQGIKDFARTPFQIEFLNTLKAFKDDGIPF